MSNANTALPASHTLTFDGTTALVDFANEEIVITERIAIAIHFDDLAGMCPVRAFDEYTAACARAGSLTAWEASRIVFVAGLAQKYVTKAGVRLNNELYTVEELAAAA